MLVEMKEPLERLTVPIGGAREAASGKQPQNLATERPQNVATEKRPELVARSPGIEFIDNQHWSKYLAREEEWGKRGSKLDAEDVPLAQKLHDYAGHMVTLFNSRVEKDATLRGINVQAAITKMWDRIFEGDEYATGEMLTFILSQRSAPPGALDELWMGLWDDQPKARKTVSDACKMVAWKRGYGSRREARRRGNLKLKL